MDFIADTFRVYPVVFFAMKSTPRSSRKRCGRRSSREDVAIDPPSVEAQPLGDEASGTGSPTTSTQGVVDPAGVNGFVDPQSAFPRRTFRIDGVEDYRMDRYVTETDTWSLDVIGKCFRFKEMELEDDPDFRSRHPSNIFKIQFLVHFDPVKKNFLSATVRYARKRLFS